MLHYILLALTLQAQNWPQAAGPNGTWQIRTPQAPTDWSVSKNQNIAWRTRLPNGGQSGIAVWGDRVFLTTFAPYKDGDPKFSASIEGHCLDARSGKLLWSVPLEGAVKSPMMYAYSDSTTPTPVTDGKHVFFFNASGAMGAYDFQGKQIWIRHYTPWGEPFPFNKQHEPILAGDVILNVEPLDNNPPAKQGWNYLRGIDKHTGRTLWIAEDGTTAYATSVYGKRANGQAAILTGRGGWHDVPERPVGLSLLSLAPNAPGKSIWRFVAGDGNTGGPTWQALYTLHWDTQYAYWFRLNPEESHLVLDANSGDLLKEQSLIRNVDYRQWDPARQAYITHKGVNLREVRDLSPRNKMAPNEVIRVMPAWHANIVHSGYHYFLTTTAHRRNRQPPAGRAGPSHCIARVHIVTGKVEYLEVPVTVIRKSGEPDKPIYGIPVVTSTVNSAGQDVGAEARSRTDGWEIPAFWGSPIAINDNLYFTTMPGITYVVNAKAATLDEHAILAINDLGPSGDTWTLNTPSFGGGHLFHRTLKELIAIRPKKP
ncbi:MAG: PQQ-binding-like beta-propeller repeat protein [Bryobacteraceae bacterium]